MPSKYYRLRGVGELDKKVKGLSKNNKKKEEEEEEGRGEEEERRRRRRRTYRHRQQYGDYQRERVVEQGGRG